MEEQRAASTPPDSGRAPVVEVPDPAPEADAAAPTAADEEERYTVLSERQRRLLVWLMGYLTLASSLTATIYFPLIELLAQRYDVSVQAVNLTITLYLVFQGVAPSIWSPLSDSWGRRPVYLANFVIFTAASLGLSLPTGSATGRSYPALLVLRSLQSVGASAILSLAYATVSDIVVHADRGAYLAPALAIANVGPCIGPVVGGGLVHAAGDERWCFRALLIFGGTSTLLIAGFMPETGRRVVGNGSVPARGIWRTWWNVLSQARTFHGPKGYHDGGQAGRNPAAEEKPREGLDQEQPCPTKVSNDRKASGKYKQPAPNASSNSAPAPAAPNGKGKLILANPLASLRIVFYADTFLVLWLAGSPSALLFCMQTSLSPIFATRYGFNPLEVGLCFLAGGVGVYAAGFVSGRLLDYNYKHEARRAGLPINRVSGDNINSFPIERARTRGSLTILATSLAAVVGFGWAVEYGLHPAAPLVLQAIIGLKCATLHQIYGALIIDIFPEKPGAAAASKNITRCALAGLFVAVLDPMVAALGYGWVFTLLALLDALSCAAAVLALNRWGPQWRGSRHVLTDP